MLIINEVFQSLGSSHVQAVPFAAAVIIASNIFEHTFSLLPWAFVFKCVIWKESGSRLSKLKRGRIVKSGLKRGEAVPNSDTSIIAAC